MKKLLLLISAIALFSGCYYDVAEELYPDAGSSCDTTVKGYAARIAPIMTANCTLSGCHDAAGSQAPDLTNYTETAANAAVIKQRVLIDKDMPPSGPLSSCDMQALQQWLDNGALNN